MATTYTLITSQTLASSAASVSFTSIPGTYTDLMLRISSRTTNSSTSSYLIPTWNTDTATNYSNTMFYTNDGSSVGAGIESSVSPSTNNYNTRTNGAGSTSNTFAYAEIYIPFYTSSQNKQIFQFGCEENNATGGIFLCMIASSWRNTSSISQLSLTPYGTDIFVANSSFYLYGISNA
jgi:hypothetical protein